ncbi:MAG: serine/threonine-protein kinase [Polyangiaceae bacterium]
MGLQPGEILDGKYRIVRLVGEGGMGAVYEGENTRIKRTVAIKVLHASVAEKTDVVQRFEREAQAAGRIGSEHIVEVLDLGNLPSGERFMVMEFLEGEDLTARIKRLKRLTPQQAVPILVQVLEGLAAAHDAGIIHRDLKPDNIFILRNKAGRADFVKILDFGVSKFSALDSDMSMTKTGAVMGTPYYMSPEQAKGGKIDARSDLYAVGVVLYQAITGRVPFNASSFNELLFKIALEQPDPIASIVPDCPASFIAIVDKAMAREADQRFSTARDFQQALAVWQPAGSGQHTVPLNAFPDMRQPSPSMSGASSPGMGGPTLGSNPSWASQTGPSQPGVPIPTANPQLGNTGPGATGPMAATGAELSGAYPQQAATGPNLGASHSPLAITSHSNNGKNGMMVALLAAGIGIIGLVAVGAYLFTRPADGSPAPAQTGEPSAEATPSAPPPPEPPAPEPTSETSEDDGGEQPEVSATTSASSEAPPPPQPPTQPQAQPPRPQPPRPQPPAPQPPKPQPPKPQPPSGRPIQTEL